MARYESHEYSSTGDESNGEKNREKAKDGCGSPSRREAMLTWGLRYDASIFRIEPIAPSTDLRRPNEETNKQRINGPTQTNKQTNRQTDVRAVGARTRRTAPENPRNHTNKQTHKDRTTPTNSGRLPRGRALSELRRAETKRGVPDHVRGPRMLGRGTHGYSRVLAVAKADAWGTQIRPLLRITSGQRLTIEVLLG
jgi:hypothetical protein